MKNNIESFINHLINNILSYKLTAFKERLPTNSSCPAAERSPRWSAMTSQTFRGRTIQLAKAPHLSLQVPETKAITLGQGTQMGRDVRAEGNSGAMLIPWISLE
jgi:hypothetical protein